MNAFLDSVMGSYNDKSKESKSQSLRALAWSRVSTDMQEERGLSMPEQLRQIREYAKEHGIEIVEEFFEAASAFKKNAHRDEFDKMLARAKSDKTVNVILVHDFSRFSRDSLGARLLVRELLQSGVRVISLNDMEIDTESVAGVYMEAITFAKNEAYSREVAFHTKKGCRANIQTRDPETGWCYKNGGQPLFGYRGERLVRGEVKKGRPLVKSIWVPDDTIVAGKPIYEWARYCLVELAGQGATLDELRDFCNKTGIPAPRKEFWGHTTWNSILDPHCLLEYAGFGVWNVRGKNQRHNPISDWVIVENAHEALISEDETKQILAAREQNKYKAFDKGYGRSKDSSYLLSGGLFTCKRCGSNLLGIRKSKNSCYYICGSQPHRKGLGCGQAVYVPQAKVETEVLTGLVEMLDELTNTDGLIVDMNKKIKKEWADSVGYDPSIPHKLEEINQKINNIRKAIENGLPDQSWGFSRMSELISEKETLSEQDTIIGEAPQIDGSAASSYREQARGIMKTGTNAQKKRLIRSCVNDIALSPDTLRIEILYKIPDLLVHINGSGDWI